jgi:uncharacterized protein (TIGR00369 family)
MSVRTREGDVMDGFAGKLGVYGESAEEGSARLELDAGEEHLNPAGTVHGGVLATLVDAAMGLAVRSATGDEEIPATSQLSVTYLSPGKPGRLVATAEVRKRGKHLTICEAGVEQDGETLVHSIATFALVRR